MAAKSPGTRVVTVLLDDEKSRTVLEEPGIEIIDGYGREFVVQVREDVLSKLRERGIRIFEMQWALRHLPMPGTCVPTTPIEEIRTRYSQYLSAEPAVADVANVPALPQTVSDRLWVHLRYLEDCQSTFVPVPASHPDSSWLTNEERDDIWAAKVAHTLWVDRNGLVPWALSSFDRSALETLLTPAHFFEQRTVDGVIRDVMGSLIDHSPSEAYDTARAFVRPTLAETVSAVVTASRFPRFVHGVAGRHPIHLTDTLHEMWDRGVSLWGCHSASKMLVGLTRSLNIPAQYEYGWYAGEAHGSAVWPGAGVLLHGDDLYDALLTSTPMDHLLAPYNYFRYAIVPYGRYTEQAAWWTLRRNRWLAALFPSPYLIDQYCNLDTTRWSSRREYLDDQFAGFLPPYAVEDIEDRIAIAGGCS